MKHKIHELVAFTTVIIFLFPFFFAPVTADGSDAKVAGVTEEKSDVAGHLKRLEKNMAAFESMKTDFVQEKSLAVFKKKIVLKGRIFVQKPNRVAWHVDKPVKYSVLITDKFIRQWDEDTGKVQEISLSGNPVFRVVIKQMTAWFSGSFSSLQDEYYVKIVRQRPFVVEFTPKENNFSKKVIKSVTVSFRDDERYLSRISIRERSGDVTTIIFENTLLNIPLDERFFRIEHRV
jgi:outer membrane lipoprotein-sorting protein